MRKSFDRRVLPERVLGFIRRCQERVPCHLAGGAALAGAYLSHRTTGEVDLLSSEELRRFRDELAQRLRRAAVP